jgi:NADPH:quinone reductase
MRAVCVREFGPFETVRVEDVPAPSAGPGEVVVDVVAAECNYPDILVIEGRYQIKPALPFVPGKAATGRVVQLGPDVTRFGLGDAVSVQVEYGAYAERVCVPEEGCFPIPDGVTFDVAAALGLTYQTAWFALKDRARLAEGESVLVLGAAGGVGYASVQLAKALGASTVVAGVRGASNAAVARRAGADHVVELSDPALRDSLRAQTAAATHGRGIDVVIDPVGGEASAAALRALAWCGRQVVVGFAAGDIPTFKANYLLVKNIAVSGLQWSDYRDRAPERVATAQAEIFELYRRGRLSPFVSRRFPLGEFAQGLRILRDGLAQGKILLETGRA